MIKFTYNYYGTEVTVIFDNEFEIKMINDLDAIKEKIEWAFNEYGFDYAMVVSDETGEILMEATWEED